MGHQLNFDSSIRACSTFFRWGLPCKCIVIAFRDVWKEAQKWNFWNSSVSRFYCKIRYSKWFQRQQMLSDRNHQTTRNRITFELATTSYSWNTGVLAYVLTGYFWTTLGELGIPNKETPKVPLILHTFDYFCDFRRLFRKKKSENQKRYFFLTRSWGPSLTLHIEHSTLTLRLSMPILSSSPLDAIAL